MACSQGPELQDYLSDELPLPERARLEEHLHHCSACRRDLAELQQLERLLAELAPQSPPQGFACRTLLKARAELAPVRRYRPVRAGLMTATGAAAALLVFMLQVGLRQPLPPAYAPLAAVAPVELASAALVTTARPVLRAAHSRPAAEPELTRLAAAPDRPARGARSAERFGRPADRTLLAQLAGTTDRRESAAAAAYVEATRHASGDPEVGVAALENVAAAYPDSRQAAKALLAAANLQRRRGNLAEADGAYRRVLALHTGGGLTTALAHKGLAEVRSDSVGEDEVALYHYGEAARSLRRQTAGQAPGSQAQALVVLADIEKTMGQRDRAAADYAAVANSGVRSLATDQTTTALAEVL